METLSAATETSRLQLEVEVKPAARLWTVPIEAASASEKGFERTYQGQCLYLCWPLDLEMGATARFGLTWRPGRLDQ